MLSYIINHFSKPLLAEHYRGVASWHPPKSPKSPAPTGNSICEKHTKTGPFLRFFLMLVYGNSIHWAMEIPWKFHEISLKSSREIFDSTNYVRVNLPSYPSLLLSPGHPFPHLSNTPESQNQWIGFSRNIETGKPVFVSQNLHFSTKPKRSKSHCTSNPKPVTFEIFWGQS